MLGVISDGGLTVADVLWQTFCEAYVRIFHCALQVRKPILEGVHCFFNPVQLLALRRDLVQGLFAQQAAGDLLMSALGVRFDIQYLLVETLDERLETHQPAVQVFKLSIRRLVLRRWSIILFGDSLRLLLPWLFSSDRLSCGELELVRLERIRCFSRGCCDAKRVVGRHTNLARL